MGALLAGLMAVVHLLTGLSAPAPPVQPAPAKAAPAPAASPTPKPTPKPTPRVKAALPARHPAVLDHQGSATRVLVVTSASWTTTYAKATAWEKRNGRWVAVRKDMPARVGRSGFKTDRREGDGSTPAGQFSFRSAFGSKPSPGTRLPWRALVPRSCWSGERADYNTWVHRDCTSRDEDLYASRTLAYLYAAVIGFNDSPVVWGKGSGIFLHVTTGRPTAGCVALSQDDTVAMLRWLDRGAKIVMGPQSYVDRL